MEKSKNTEYRNVRFAPKRIKVHFNEHYPNTEMFLIFSSNFKKNVLKLLPYEDISIELKELNEVLSSLDFNTIWKTRSKANCSTAREAQGG